MNSMKKYRSKNQKDRKVISDYFQNISEFFYKYCFTLK